MKLRPYQEQIVNELRVYPAAALYMKTGTGKTLTSLELSKYYEVDNLLVVCPQNAINQWKININEQRKDFEVIELKNRWSSKQIAEHLKDIEFRGKALVINYDMIHRIPFILTIIDESWLIISDEIHRIKNYGTFRRPVKVTHFMLKLGEKTPYKLGLTATPTQGLYGGYVDYYSQLKFLGYIDMSIKDFYNKYVIQKKKYIGSTPIDVIAGYKNINEIDDILSYIAKRYSPKYGDFEPQFNKIYLDKSKNYNKMLREQCYGDITLSNAAKKRIAKKTLTTGVVYGKDPFHYSHSIRDNSEKEDWLYDFLSDTDETVSIFYTYNVELYSLIALAEKLGKKYIVINGDTKDKYDLINRGDYNLVIGQFRAMGEAIDGLHNYCHIEVFFSMPESSISYTQAIGRIDRIGQKEVPMYYFLIMKDTIDEEIMNNIDLKIEFSELTLNKLEV